MAFFDLNIPYIESSPSDKGTVKTARIKLVIKAMELGYTGIAYNRTIKGIMSDHDRCSISTLSLSSLLKIAPSLSSSVGFHRDLLGVPRSSPFRQYTRLTVCVDSPSQGQVLNSGNPVLKSYDLVAVRPVNQSAFDYASEKAEVDIISIDFSEKLPFRLKLPMVKSAIERGVYFEITYSDLIADIQARRQMISNAKLLVDWTRGKNLILSSDAPSANELRGPYDVANLSSLLGLSMERAKAAISKNCRTLIANALRKKHFYKETIRVEVISSGEQLDSKEPWSGDWLKWDPISSGEGDLLLDDMAKSFSASGKVSKTAKAINFASIIDSMPSHGFQVKDLISRTKPVSQIPDNDKNFLSSTKVIEVSVATDGVSGQPSGFDFLPQTDHTSLDKTPAEHQSSGFEGSQKLYFPSGTVKAFTNTEEIGTLTTTTKEVLKNSSALDIFVASSETESHDLQSEKCISSHELNIGLPNEKVTYQTLARDIDQASLDSTPAEYQTSGCEDLQKLLLPGGTTKAFANTGETGTRTSTTIAEEELKNSNGSNVLISSTETQSHGLQSEKCISSNKLNVGFRNENLTCQTSYKDIELDAACKADANVEVSTLVVDISIPAPKKKESKGSKSSDIGLCVQSVAMDDIIMEMDMNDRGDMFLALNDASMHDNVSEREQFGEPGSDTIVADQFLCVESCDEMKAKDDSSVSNHEASEEVIMVEPKHGGADTKISHRTSIQSIPGKHRAKQRRHHRGLLLFPLSRVLNPITFKKKAKKFKRRKMV